MADILRIAEALATITVQRGEGEDSIVQLCAVVNVWAVMLHLRRTHKAIGTGSELR
jgi:hypothetical protein